MAEHTESEASGTFETRKDAGEGPRGVWKLWTTSLDLAGVHEEKWREKAKNASERYRDELVRRPGRFNILYSTMETMAPSIYNSTPLPDVRRRFNDEDVVGKVASQVFERSLSHCIDEYDFDAVMGSSVHDSLLRGRGQAIVIYDPVEEGGEVQYETTRAEHVQWDDFRHGPGKKWEDVPWAAIRYRITREGAIALNPKIGGTVSLDHIEKGADKDDKDVPDVFKRLTIWKIWDKIKRQIVFIAPSYKEGPFATEDDALHLNGFYPFPRPMYDIPDPSSLVPLVPYEMYRDQAEELDEVSARIRKLTKVLRWRGIRPAQITEMDRLKDADDGELIPSESAAAVLAMVQTGGDMSKAIWIMPIETLIVVIRELVLQREAIKQVIFEITGIADILRGATDPNETLGAQRLKAQFGTVRMQKRQREVQRFARDLIRIKAEIIGEQYSTETLALISSIQLPTGEQKFQAQTLAAQAQQTGQEPPEGVQEVLQAPTWDEVKAIMASDALRSFRVDIETNSTILEDLGQAQQNIAGFVEGFGAFITAVGPAVQAGVMPLDVATDLLTGFARNFKLGRQAEDALERLGQQPKQPQEAQPDPAQLQAQEDAKMKEAELGLKREEIDAKAQERAQAVEQANAKDEVAAQDRARDMMLRSNELQFQQNRQTIEDARRNEDLLESRQDNRTKQDFEQRKFDGTEAGTARNDLASELEAIRAETSQIAEAVQQSLAASTEALRQVALLTQALGEPKIIDVKRASGRITGGTVTQGGLSSEIVLN